MSRAEEMTQGQAEEILGLPERYGKRDLRRAFTDKAREYHPDNAARNGMSAEEAQRRMVEVNKANDLLKRFFDANPHQTIHRDMVAGSVGSAGVGVHFDPEGQHAAYTTVDDSLFWDEHGNARGTVQEDAAATVADASGHRLRRFLLGPVLLRLIFVVLLGWLWWRTFPFLPENAGAYGVDDPAAHVDWVRVICATVYPTYFLLYELFGGGISGTVRELLNGLVSLITRVHVEVRPKGAYRSSLSRLIGGQWYGALLAPLAAWLGTLAYGWQGDATMGYVLWALCALVAVDALLSCFGTGLANSLADRIADAIEKRYVSARMALLKRCGQWGGTAPSGPATDSQAQAQAQPESQRRTAAPKHGRHAAAANADGAAGTYTGAQTSAHGKHAARR